MQRLADELETTCKECKVVYKYSENHERHCQEKEDSCFFEFLGCEWKGPRKFHKQHLAEAHRPKCTEGHLFVRVQNDKSAQRFCDVCDQTITLMGFAYTCKNEDTCDYDECPGWFSHRPVRSLAPGCSAGRRTFEDFEYVQSVDDSSNHSSNNDLVMDGREDFGSDRDEI